MKASSSVASLSASFIWPKTAMWSRKGTNPSVALWSCLAFSMKCHSTPERELIPCKPPGDSSSKEIAQGRRCSIRFSGAVEPWTLLMTRRR